MLSGFFNSQGQRPLWTPVAVGEFRAIYWINSFPWPSKLYSVRVQPSSGPTLWGV